MNNLLKFMAALAPSTLLLLILFQIFPYTGLGRIVTTPLTYMLNIGVIGLGFLIVHLLKHRFSIAVWIIVGVVTLGIAVWLYPQENQEHIIYQISNAVGNRQEFLSLTQELQQRGPRLFWILMIGITVGLIGRFFLAKNTTGGLIASLFAGVIGALVGNHFFEYWGMRGWFSLVFAFFASCALVFVVDSIVRSTNSES
ncbi:GlsB/YeaQ/YmgE family stress response membrane protein [Saccharibacillus sacchari]|uniref:GlsB/YeaQ/YmgE family stress response membrane protein n=1 Tax=Saccharibacillus sacchari TaxID=456493 RepID=UPI0004AEF940|nr:GlsB/YeaQ/YmgE family stress response membrane protein [Saccharibacillus sacchari]